MGLTRVTIEIAGISAPDAAEAVTCLVDSGATWSVIPRAILDRLGIKPYAKDKYCLANGDIIERERGPALFKYEGKIGSSDVVFGEEDDSILLGVMTLEALGLALDPFKRELRPIPMILGGYADGGR